MNKTLKQGKQDLIISFPLKMVVAIFTKTKLADKCKLFFIFLILQSTRN